MRTQGTARAAGPATAQLFRKRFESLVDCSIQGIAVHRGHRIVFANATLAHMFGYRGAKRLLGTHPHDLVAPEDRKRVAAYGVERRAGRPAPERYEFRGRHRSGRTLWLEVRVSVVEWDGAPANLSTLVDITERKQAEQSLQASEERFRNLVEGSLEGIAVVRNGRVLFLNRTLAEMFRFRDPDDALRHGDWVRHLAPDERARVRRYARTRMQGGDAPSRYEFQGRCKDGTPIWLDASVRVIEWHGQPAIQATLIDITGRKRTEEQLSASQTLLRTVVDSIPHALFAKDRKGRYLIANRATSSLYGLEPREIVGRTDAQLPHGDSRQTALFRRTDRKVLATGRPLHLPEALLVDRSGKRHWRAIHKVPLRDRTGAVVGVVGVSEVVTARKEAEEATRAERRLLEAVLNAIPTPISFKDLECRYRFVNRAFSAAWKRPAGEFIGRRVNELPGLPKALAAQLAQHDRQTLRKGGAVELPEVAIRTARGDVVRRILKIPVKDGRRRVTGLISISEDITKRKRAEADLLAAKNLLEQILANIPVGLSVVDKDLRIRATNGNFLRLLGFPRKLAGPNARFEDFIRHNAGRGEYGPGDVETLVAQRVALARKFQPHRFERVRPGGPALEISGNPLPGGGFITTYTDITERRQAEEQLRANQRLLQTVLDSLPHFLTVKDAKGRYQLVNRAFAAFWRQPPEAFLGRRPRELEFIPAAYAREIDRSDRPTLENGRAIDSTTRQVSPFGQRIVQRVIKVPVRGADDRVDGVVALIEDITERVRADEELRANRRLLQMVFDVIPINLFVKDTESRFVMANRAQCAFYGLTAGQFAGLPTARLPGMTPALLKTTLDYDRQVLVAGIVAPVAEYERANAAGSVRWLRGLKLPLLDDAGKVVGLVGMAEDVTEHRRAQEALEAGQRLLRTVVDSIPVNLFVKDAQGRFVLINRNYAEFYGVEPEAVIGQTAGALSSHTPAHLADIDEWDRRVLTSGKRDEVPVLERFDRQGRLHLFHGVKLPLRDAQGAISGLIGMTQDITAQRQAARALQESEQRMRVLLENAPILIYSIDREGTFTMSEGKELATVGRKPGEVVGRSAFAVFKHLPDRIRQLRRGLAGEAFSGQTLVDGQWFDTRHEPIRDAGGNVTGLVVVSTNITQRHVAELEAQASRRLLQTVFDTIPHSLWVKDAQGRFLMVNHSQAHFYGLRPEDMTGMSPLDLPNTPRDLAQTWIAEDRQVIEHGRLLETPLARIPRREGGSGWFHLVTLPLRDERGDVVGVVGLAEDVTQRMQATEALRASQRLLQAIFDTIPHRLWVKDVQGNFLLVNHAQARYYGLAPEQMAGLATRDLPGLTAAQKQALAGQDRRVVEGGETIDEPELAFPTATGEPGWIRMIKLPLRNETGGVIAAIGLAEDITDRKRAELEARDSRRLLQTLFDTIPYELFVKDRDGTYLMVNHAMARFYGTTPQQMVGMRTLDLPGLSSGQIEALAADDRQVIESGQSLDIPAVLLPDAQGSARWMHTIKFPLRDGQGRVVGVVGLGENVTDRKRSEEDLRASRLLLQTVFDTIPMYLNVKDVKGRFVLVNKAGARFEGMSQAAFHNLPTEQLPNRSPAQIREILEIDRRVLQNGEEVDVGEYTRADGQGRQRWLRGRKLPLRDEQGHVTGLLAVVEDITEHKVALEQLHASRRLLQTVFDALPLRVVVRDAQGRYLMVNRRMAEDHQRPPEAFVGQHFWNDEELPSEERQGVLARIRQAEATGQPVLTPELAITLPGADRRLLRSIFVPLYDEHGTFQGTLGIGEDITERKKSEQALLQAQKLESLGVLAGGIAHDFNNLLVTIMGNASLAMLKLPPSSPPMEELQQIEMAGQRAADLCRQMLSYAGKGRIEKQPVSINQLVQEMTQLLRVSLPKGVSIVFRMMANPPLTEVDPTQIRQVIMNLVINAGEAIGENPGTIAIATGVTHVDRNDLAEAQSEQDTAEGDYVYLEVSDTGAGMDAETRARIFDPFFTTKFTGRGLGLASVLGIVRGHRGALKVYSEVGKGTSFKVLLPVALEAAVPLEPPQETGGWSGGGTILVIDDEPSIRSVAARMLTRLGFQVLEAADGATAVEIVRNPPAPLTAALLDLTMPGLSGEETLRRLRRLDKKLPVILMSGYNEREVLDRFVGREVAGFLQKPFKLDDLRGKLRELFQASATSGATPSA